MKLSQKSLLTLLLLAAAPISRGHLFTDLEGRQVEAEIAGMRGDNVVLAAGGLRAQWPVAKLSKPDQDYAQEWRAGHTGVDRITARAFERDGMGPRGAFPAAEQPAAAPGPPPGPPIGPGVEVKAAYRHYELELANPAKVDAAHLQAEYTLYVISPDGAVRASAGRQDAPTIPAGKIAKITTEGATAAKTKATRLKISLSNNNLSAREKTERSQDQFGGLWVKIRGADGKVIGELKQLSPALAKLDPPWEETAVREDIPLLASFEAFKELLRKALPPGPPARP